MVPTKTIVIVGGGTAGWLTALFLNKFFPTFTVTVIESEEIGILGAGEGTVPNIITMLESLGIDYQEVINETNGTIKLGVKFDNWNGDNDYYYHSFVATNPTISEVLAGPNYINSDGSFLSHGMVANDIIIGKNTPFAQASEVHRSPFVNIDGNLRPSGFFALHFDARLLANFLRKTAISRGVLRKEGIVTQVNTDENSFITSIDVGNKEKISTDFVFDCSGFQRLIIKNVYNSEWKSYQEFLPVNSAVAFFLDQKESIKPYTTARAMKYGWMWQIPLQHRIGCGYVFDNSYIDYDEAVKEIEETIGGKITVQRTFKFNAGCFKKTWIKNSIALGLSGGFIEPLEATSIMMVIKSLEIFKTLAAGIDCKDDSFANRYNEEILKLNDHISKFLFAHYMSQRSDTEFWKKEIFKQNELLDYVKNIPINHLDADMNSIFGPLSWLIILQGNKQLDKELYLKSLSLQNLDEVWKNTYNKYCKNVNQSLNDLLDHNYFLEIIKK